MSDLKPCPFCGSCPESSMPTGMYVTCSNNECPIGDPGATKWLLREAWNTRAPTEDTARADAAEAKLKHIMNRLSYLVAVWHGSAQTADDCGDDIADELKGMEKHYE